MPGADPASVWVTFCLEPPSHPWETARQYLALAAGTPGWEGLAFPKSFAPSCAVAVHWGYRLALLVCITAQRCVTRCIPRRGRAASGSELFATAELAGKGSAAAGARHVWWAALGTDGSRLGKAVKSKEAGLGCRQGGSAFQPLDRIHPRLSGSWCQGLAR